MLVKAVRWRRSRSAYAMRQSYLVLTTHRLGLPSSGTESSATTGDAHPSQ